MTPKQSPKIAEPPAVRCTLADKGAEIVVHVEERVIQFYRCHAPRKFLSLGMATEHVVCSFDEIEAYYCSSGRGNTWLTIVTSSGTATIDDKASGFKALCSWLDENIVSNPAAHPEDSPWMPYTYIGSAAVGMLAVPLLAMYVLGFLWPSAPVLTRPASNGMVGLYLLGGAFVGVAFVRGLVKLAAGVLNISLVTPIARGFAGSFVGLILGHWLSASTGSMFFFLGFIVVGFVAGVFAGSIPRLACARSARMPLEDRGGVSSSE